MASQTSSSTSSSALTSEQDALKQAFQEQNPHVPFDLGQETLLKLSPRFFASTLRLRDVPRRHGYLSPKIHSLIHLSLSSSLTHLHPPTITSSTLTALSHGATPAEILETLHLTATIGIHACNIGVPILVDVLKRHDPEAFEAEYGRPSDGAMEEGLKRDFERKRGYWHAFWEDFLRVDPEFFEAYLEMSSVPWTHESDTASSEGSKDLPGVLPPKIKELIYIAFDASATHLYTPGLRLHMENAVRLGATGREIMEVLEICGAQGVVGAEVGAGALGRGLAEGEREGEGVGVGQGQTGGEGEEEAGTGMGGKFRAFKEGYVSELQKRV